MNVQHLARATVLLAVLSVAGCALAVPSPETAPAGAFLLHDGDTWVQAGDSITWQKLYTTYLEAFIRARYPHLKFAAVNSGKSGEVTIQGLIRFKSTIAAYHPTLVTSAYGMNDHTKVFPADQHFEDNPSAAPQRFGKLVKDCGARWVVLSASPLLAPPDYPTDGGTFALTPETKLAPPGWRSNPVNRLFATKMRTVAATAGAPYLDQMTPLQVIWAANYPRDRVAALRSAIAPFEAAALTPESNSAFVRALKPFSSAPEVFRNGPAPDSEGLIRQLGTLKTGKENEAVRQYLVGWAKMVDASEPPFVRLSGYTGSVRPDDLIHPNEAGHVHMAAIVFKLMGADPLVSEVELDAKSGLVLSSRRARVSSIVAQNGEVSFKRLDDSLPLPIDPPARPGLAVDVTSELGSPRDLFGMSQYLLKVTNLPAGRYEITIDGEVVANADSASLAAGIDLGLCDKGPIARQCRRLLEAVQQSVISAPFDKLTSGALPSPQTPKVLAEAQPVEHQWTVRRVR